MFRRILIYALGAVFLTAGGVRAQHRGRSPHCGLEGNAEYMSLLREDAQLQIREDSIDNAVERSGRQLREDPGQAAAVFAGDFAARKQDFRNLPMPRDA